LTSGRKYGTAALETNCTLLGYYKQKTCLSRHDTVLLNRLRIGHTRLTHSYLLSGDDLPECGTCQCALTVKHILVECVDLKDVRNKHFVASSIKDLFDSIEAHKIIVYGFLFVFRTTHRNFAKMFNSHKTRMNGLLCSEETMII